MKKLLPALILCLLLLSVPQAAAAAVYEFADWDMTIELPDELQVLLRDMPEDSPILAELGVSAAEVNEQLMADNRYLQAQIPGSNDIVVITMEQDMRSFEIWDLYAFGDRDLRKHVQYLPTNEPVVLTAGDSVITDETIGINAAYLVYHERTDEGNYMLTYRTVKKGREIKISLISGQEPITEAQKAYLVKIKHNVSFEQESVWDYIVTFCMVYPLLFWGFILLILGFIVFKKYEKNKKAATEAVEDSQDKE